MSNTVTGTVYSIGQTQQISDKFSKREIAVTTSETYPQTILFQFSNDKCSLLDNVRIGDNVTISYNLRGRIWTDKNGVEKIFNTIDGWNIILTSLTGNNVQAPHVANTPAPNQSFQQREQSTLTQKTEAAPVQIGDDGLPF
jgi:single-strand DNA-binding protein